MNWFTYLAFWLFCSWLTYIQFKRVVRRERANPDLMFNNPKMLIAFNVLANTQLGHLLIGLASLIPLFWVMMLIDVITQKQN